jgi:hypothetical protein
MKAFLTSAYNYGNNYKPANWLKSKSISNTSICTDNPEDADVIVFIESHPVNDPYFTHVFNNKIYKKYKNKCVLYHDADLSITPMPTISPSIELWQYNPKHKRSSHYIARVCENETIDKALVNFKPSRKYLYSFIGSKTHSVRSAIIGMKHPVNAYIKDTSSLKAWELDSNQKFEYEREYYEIMNESFFILCPRGIGPCSYRLFETMQLGRVPVIISNQWVEIPGIKWDDVSIRVDETLVHKLPEILAKREKDAVEMGRNARKSWEQFFSPEVSLNQIASSALKLVKNNYSFLDSLIEYLQFIKQPSHLKNFLRYRKNKLKRKLRTA